MRAREREYNHADSGTRVRSSGVHGNGDTRHAGDVAALTLTESLGGLTLYHKAHAQLHHAALAHLALYERAHRV